MSRYWNEDRKTPNVWPIVRDTLAVFLAVIALSMWGCPQYTVWTSGLAGKAELRRAEQNRQIAIQEAQAKRDAAAMLSEAEIARARGVAEANRIIGESLHQNQDYLRYLWITEVAGKDVNKTVVYIPTEANVPILEAGRKP